MVCTHFTAINGIDPPHGLFDKRMPCFTLLGSTPGVIGQVDGIPRKARVVHDYLIMGLREKRRGE